MRTGRYLAVLLKSVVDGRLTEKLTIGDRLKKKKGKEEQEKKKEEEVPGRSPRLRVAHVASPPTGLPRTLAARGSIARHLKNSLAIGNLASQFEGKYVQLSVQKFSSNGPVRAALVKAIVPHEAALRTNPYCKRIFSRALLKK
ncbi:hypothetical protein BHE74_00011138 [Ensete ventricosum]|nr:hypothetical protein GW17_00039263 [Ensete ventricosum]RWW80510.1 hypothetical protein BHE74_00011138 [Ensete ventricosum]RZR83158.1 hypothetical protein BHM03_00009714 [Ensete ventricosum]